MGGGIMIRLTAERAREDVWSAALLDVLRLHRRLIRLERLLARIRRAEDSIFEDFDDRLIPERLPHVVHVDRLLQEGLGAEALHLHQRSGSAIAVQTATRTGRSPLSHNLEDRLAPPSGKSRSSTRQSGGGCPCRGLSPRPASRPRRPRGPSA